ncbi:hypothetical protein [Paenibacillus popilliae]|uniref:hypothetical protein n=1 Tax=Paenibacillus popilliae TaxID=78057 RepID=UPI0021AEB51E|nr:hypothetical protein [Paenibacillus sp. SDF0028]
MNSNKKWGSILIAAVLLMTSVSVAQAKSTVPTVTITETEDAIQTEGNDAGNPQLLEQPTDDGGPAMDQAKQTPDVNHQAVSSSED